MLGTRSQSQPAHDLCFFSTLPTADRRGELADFALFVYVTIVETSSSSIIRNALYWKSMKRPLDSVEDDPTR
jgi:hypothetical protein